jgi:hypothetical protein
MQSTSEPVLGGPLEAFFEVTGKNQADFENQLKAWSDGAIALFLAEFAYRESHDTALNETVDEVVGSSKIHRGKNEALDFLKRGS